MYYSLELDRLLLVRVVSSRTGQTVLSGMVSPSLTYTHVWAARLTHVIRVTLYILAGSGL